ncbi:hypothetical protein AMS68_004473 [Peltaster fructicola]|uniref:RRM domain-containing protein n=1 Tax=Peltaster fructicola TaxID=286661 RepID=A0A6H0XW96_9PEZI|nr:hypothetical protein AMS68_004473 [Peltaster fructicola]
MLADGDGSQDGEIAPNATVYVRNINERVKIPVLLEALRGLFSEYGEIQDIIAKKSLKRKGQAFIVYDEIESAQNAIDELNGFEIYGKQLSVDFAKTRSDVTVLNEDGEEALEAHKTQRIATRAKETAAAAAAAAAASAAQQSTKREHDDDDDAAQRPAKMPKVAMSAVPDEYLPPNKTLTIRELPANVTKDDLIAAFGRFPRFREVRTVPGRPLAFIEFEDAEAGEIAKNKAATMEIHDQRIRVTYRRA